MAGGFSAVCSALLWVHEEWPAGKSESPARKEKAKLAIFAFNWKSGKYFHNVENLAGRVFPEERRKVRRSSQKVFGYLQPFQFDQFCQATGHERKP
jgi:hypothetical protein